MSQSRLYCITGADGSGKSTACDLVRAELEAVLGAGSAREVSVWDCLHSQETGSGKVAPAFQNKEEAALYLADLDGKSRTLFIMHAMSRALQLGLRSSSPILLLNGYWYKYAVSELGYGVSPEVVLGATVGFTRPELTFVLDIDPESAWERRQAATVYEQGPQTSQSPGAALTRERFIGFQRKLREAWSAIEAKQERKWIHLSAQQTPQQISRSITASILADLKPQGDRL